MGEVVSDVSSNRSDKLANAAEFLKRAEDRKKIFKAIYSGKKTKTISEIQIKSGLSNRIRVLQESNRLASEDMVKKEEEKFHGELAYTKIDFYTTNKDKILRLAINKKRLEDFPTKINPRIHNSVIKVSFPKNSVKVQQVTIDDINSFSKVKGANSDEIRINIPEEDVKQLFKKILGENGRFKDWGGEKNDLFSTRLIYKKKRLTVAFVLKGMGTKGILTPGKLGKNGDQIQRLFGGSAGVFIVQYVGQISESVLEQMKAIAMAKSILENKKIYFGIIDGKDTCRLFKAYS